MRLKIDLMEFGKANVENDYEYYQISPAESN